MINATATSQSPISKYGHLTLTGKWVIKNRRKYLEYICDCGSIGWGYRDNIISGHTRSCGCLTKSLFRDKMVTHGMAKHPLYRLYAKIKERCQDITNKYYGGAGVKMCEEWENDFMSFYEWAIKNGYRKGVEIDKDKLSPYRPGKMYSPEFCCFLTKKENSRYRSISLRVNYKGVEKSFEEYCKIFNIKYLTAYNRVFKFGWTIERAFETPINVKYLNKRVRCL